MVTTLKRGEKLPSKARSMVSEDREYILYKTSQYPNEGFAIRNKIWDHVWILYLSSVKRGEHGISNINLRLSDEGELQVFQDVTEEVYWSSEVKGAEKVVFENDGTLKMYNSDDEVIGTAQQPNSLVPGQKLYMYQYFGGSGTTAPNYLTSSNQRYRLILFDTSLLIYDRKEDGYNTVAYFPEMLPEYVTLADGRLSVMGDRTKGVHMHEMWTTDTTTAKLLVLGDDGGLVLYGEKENEDDDEGQILWQVPPTGMTEKEMRNTLDEGANVWGDFFLWLNDWIWDHPKTWKYMIGQPIGFTGHNNPPVGYNNTNQIAALSYNSVAPPWKVESVKGKILGVPRGGTLDLDKMVMKQKGANDDIIYSWNIYTLGLGGIFYSGGKSHYWGNMGAYKELFPEFIKSNLGQKFAWVCCNNADDLTDKFLKDFCKPGDLKGYGKAQTANDTCTDFMGEEWCTVEKAAKRPSCACFDTYPVGDGMDEIAWKLLNRDLKHGDDDFYPKVCIINACQRGDIYKTKEMDLQKCKSLCGNILSNQGGDYATAEVNNVRMRVDCGEGKPILVEDDDDGGDDDGGDGEPGQNWFTTPIGITVTILVSVIVLVLLGLWFMRMRKRSPYRQV